MTTAWPAVVEMIRRSGHAKPCAMLDRYYRMLFSGYSTCWVRDARKAIRAAAVRSGAIPRAEEAEDGQS